MCKERDSEKVVNSVEKQRPHGEPCPTTSIASVETVRQTSIPVTPTVSSFKARTGVRGSSAGHAARLLLSWQAMEKKAFNSEKEDEVPKAVILALDF